MKLEVTSEFPTLVGRYRVPDAEGMNEELQALILAERIRIPEAWAAATSAAGIRGPTSSAVPSPPSPR